MVGRSASERKNEIEFDPRRRKASNKFLAKMGFSLFTLFSTVLAVGWMLSDVTGEYTCNDPQLGVIRLSVVRKATNVKAELTYGTGAILEGSEPPAKEGDKIQWKFAVPREWVEQGQAYREVSLTGIIEDGVVKGVIQDGAGVYPVKLERNGAASVYKQIQSHLPWVG